MNEMIVSLVIALLISAPPMASGQESSVCPGAPDTSCSAFSTLTIQATFGKCNAIASTDCLASSNARDSYVQAFRDWFGAGSDGQCANGAISAAAEAVAVAAAEVWASATSKVTCSSGGFGCGFSISNGAAVSKSMAEAVAQAAAEAGAGSSFCFADIRAVATVLAEAYGSSTARACSTGGTAESFSSAYAAEVKEAIASAFASASAQSCQGFQSGTSASSLCEGSAQSSGTFSAGDVCAALIESRENICEGTGRDMCCDSGFNRIRCACTGCNGPWFRTSRESPPTFKDADGVSCRCPSSTISKIVTPVPSPPACDCDDVQPPGSFSCLAQKDYGKCESYWMTSGRYCRKTCGKCSCNQVEEVEEIPSTDECSCSDVAPVAHSYSCEEQKFYGKCDIEWMVQNKWCEATCGRCSCPGSPSPSTTTEMIPVETECTCSDHPPPCKRFTCLMQRAFGKCEAVWMLKTDKYSEGYCQISCGRCPCENPQRVSTERPSCP